jgi:hypothetical protein
VTVAELTQDVQFTVDQHGKVTAVVITPALWQQIVEALEDIEDRNLIRSLRDRIAQGPVASGALAWEGIAGELTVGDLRRSGLLGMWKDRDDIEDSSLYARQLREAAQKREGYSTRYCWIAMS